MIESNERFNIVQFIVCKVASSNTSRFEAHTGLFRLSMKGIFDLYVPWPFRKSFIYELVMRIRTRNSTVFGRFLKKLCLYFAREGMVIDLVF